MASGRPRPILAIGVGGFLAGLFDILFAFLFFGARGIEPGSILRSIASGWMGRPAMSGGAPTAVLGLASHFLIAFSAAAVYYLASRRMRLLRDHPVPMGLLFGAAVYGFMNFVVLPLSAFPFPRAYPLRTLLPGLAAIMFLVGLPIALSVRYFGNRPRAGR